MSSIKSPYTLYMQGYNVSYVSKVHNMSELDIMVLFAKWDEFNHETKPTFDITDQTKGKIFCGKKAFAKIADSLKLPSSIHELTRFNVTFIKHEYLEDNALLSMDPDLVEMLKLMKKDIG